MQHSTKGERRVIQCLNRLKIPFKHRWLVEGREIDFIIGKYAIEIDGRKKQSCKKNEMLIKNGYIPIHLSNLQTKRSGLNNYLKKLCQQTYLTRTIMR